MNKDRMNEIDPTASITEQAANWWITLNAGPATSADHRAFGEWAARSPERIEAFLETARLTKVLKSRNLRWPDTPVEVLALQASETGADVLHLRESESACAASRIKNMQRREPPKTHFRKPVLFLAAGAASILGLVALLWTIANHAQNYETAVGEQRSFALEDGSIVTLNTASHIEVKYEKDHRFIRLLAGEALFQVARDSARPFDVIAGDMTVRAVGTQFNVDRRSLSTVVTVVEGKVAVVSAAESSASTNTKQAHARVSLPQSRMIYLSAGEQLTVEAREVSIPQPKAADLTVATAWIQRRLVFDHRSIGEVAEEFNRYNRLQIEIVSPQLRAEEMTGVFQANDPESFLDFVSKMPGVEIERNAINTKVSASLR